MPSARPKPATSKSSRPRPRARPPIQLPQDLIDVLIDKSCHDKSLLKTYSLVAKSWLHTSRIHLFRSININDATAFLAFLRFLRRPQSMTPYIRSLFIEGNERPTFVGHNVAPGQGPTIFDRDKPTDLYFNQLGFLLSQVPAIQRLRLKEFNLRLTPNDTEHGLDAFHRPTVRTRYSLEYLEFIRCNVNIPELLPIFLSMFSSIKDLAFNDDTPFASYNSRPPIIHDPSVWQLQSPAVPPTVESLSFTFSRHSLDVSFGGVLASVTKLTTPDTLRTLVLMSWRDVDLISIRRLLQSPECRCITHLVLDLEKIFSTYPSTYLGIFYALPSLHSLSANLNSFFAKRKTRNNHTRRHTTYYRITFVELEAFETPRDPHAPIHDERTRECRDFHARTYLGIYSPTHLRRKPNLPPISPPHLAHRFSRAQRQRHPQVGRLGTTESRHREVPLLENGRVLLVRSRSLVYDSESEVRNGCGRI